MKHRASVGGGQDVPATPRPRRDNDTQGDDQGGKETIPDDSAPATGDDD